MSDVGRRSRPPTSWWPTFFVVVLVIALIVWAVFSYL